MGDSLIDDGSNRTEEDDCELAHHCPSCGSSYEEAGLKASRWQEHVSAMRQQTEIIRAALAISSDEAEKRQLVQTLVALEQELDYSQEPAQDAAAAFGAAAASSAPVPPQRAQLVDRRTVCPKCGEKRKEVYGKYIMVEKLGEGTYGKVYKAMDRLTKEFFALKKIKIQYDEEGIPPTAIREVSLLKDCDHPNVIRLYDVFSHNSALYLVFEFLDMDLRVYLKRNGALTEPRLLKSAAYQCFCGVEYCHGHAILHRDLKPQNVLVDITTPRLKLADFGLARNFTVPLRAYTHEVVTLWYRAPEILLGQSKYVTAMDIWSLGCILAEMATAQALFPGDSEIDTIFKIFRTLGTPTDEVWPGVSTLKDFKKEFPKWRDTELADVMAAGPALGQDGADLLRSCFRYNPVSRPSAKRALRHAFFQTTEPLLGVD